MKFGFIGTGNMGAALAAAAVKGLGGDKVLLTNRTHEKAAALAESLGCACGTNAQAAQDCDLIFLGVKPNMMADLLAQLAPMLAARSKPYTLVSMAAGLTIARLQEMVGCDAPIIRIMPNTPCQVGSGMILYTASAQVSAEALDAFLQGMAPAGRFDQLPEALMDAGSAVSGCGPAFVYLMIEALADGGVACGLPRQKAQDYAAQTLLGAAQMVLETGKHPGALKDAVCSPGGSTIQGVRALEENGFRTAAFEAVIAAYQKTRDLGKA